MARRAKNTVAPGLEAEDEVEIFHVFGQTVRVKKNKEQDFSKFPITYRKCEADEVAAVPVRHLVASGVVNESYRHLLTDAQLEMIPSEYEHDDIDDNCQMCEHCGYVFALTEKFFKRSDEGWNPVCNYCWTVVFKKLKETNEYILCTKRQEDSFQQELLTDLED